MATDRTVRDHLLQGREALLSEIARLTTAVEELDGVLERIGGLSVNGSSAPTDTSTDTERAPAPAAKQAVRKAPAKRAATRRPARGAARGEVEGKSIRVHVLEMLGAEEREFGLAEIIDRIHGLGIRAHDDAVRSITIKLMKDGRVERVGRGQYRLAGRASGAAQTASPNLPASAEPVDAARADQPTEPPAERYVPPLDFDRDPGL